MNERCDAVVLAGGAASRMGGVDKPGLTVAGRSLLEHVVSTVRAHAPTAGVVVVGPERERPRARYVREDPPGAGPVPALRAGFARVEAPRVVLLAADLPYLAPDHLVALDEALDGSPKNAGAVLVDEAGREQWLTGVWRTGPLAAALSVYSGLSLYGLLGPLAPAHVAFSTRGRGFDVDTPRDLDRARSDLEGDRRR
ncbi:molybdenum cofactor guanylyltransferase [Nocardiopsis alba]|uniref:molybdenum cofactor guanylyltransferase n=1 Tax=Nocardiopsis alba TaxID=53437 RepID=UPI00366ADB10